MIDNGKVDILIYAFRSKQLIINKIFTVEVFITI